jgi:hypothetical protein
MELGNMRVEATCITTMPQPAGRVFASTDGVAVAKPDRTRFSARSIVEVPLEADHLSSGGGPVPGAKVGAMMNKRYGQAKAGDAQHNQQRPEIAW